MISRLAQLRAWLGGPGDPIDAALVLVSGLRSDIAAFKARLAETPDAIAAMRETSGKARCSPQPGRSRTPVRTPGYGRQARRRAR